MDRDTTTERDDCGETNFETDDDELPELEGPGGSFISEGVSDHADIRQPHSLSDLYSRSDIGSASAHIDVDPPQRSESSIDDMSFDLQSDGPNNSFVPLVSAALGSDGLTLPNQSSEHQGFDHIPRRTAAIIYPDRELESSKFRVETYGKMNPIYPHRVRASWAEAGFCFTGEYDESKAAILQCYKCNCRIHIRDLTENMGAHTSHSQSNCVLRAKGNKNLKHDWDISHEMSSAEVTQEHDDDEEEDEEEEQNLEKEATKIKVEQSHIKAKETTDHVTDPDPEHTLNTSSREPEYLQVSESQPDQHQHTHNAATSMPSRPGVIPISPNSEEPEGPSSMLTVGELLEALPAVVYWHVPLHVDDDDFDYLHDLNESELMRELELKPHSSYIANPYGDESDDRWWEEQGDEEYDPDESDQD